MSNTNKDYCLILAGGAGTRLWPVSRKSKPKQFLDLYGTGRTLLQQTYDRFAQFIDPSHIYVSTLVDYLPLVYEQLPQVDDVHILEEPLDRGTLASGAWGTVVITKVDSEARIIVSPADQQIVDEAAFRADVLKGLEFVGSTPDLLVMGVRATRPETGYGYIQMGDDPVTDGISRVKSFTEKPERSFAEMFLNDGGFLWNTGLYMFASSVMLDCIYKLSPDYQQEIPRMMADAETADPKFQPEFFSWVPRLSIDMSILERSDNVCVQECHFGWADLGTWVTLKHQPLEENQTICTRAILRRCKGNVIRLPEGRVAVVEGLTDYVIAEEGDVLLICPKDSATVRRMRQEAVMEMNLD